MPTNAVARDAHPVDVCAGRLRARSCDNPSSPELDDFARALERTIVQAKRELIATGECTHRAWSRCADGSTISESDGFVGSVNYFDSRGRAIGEEKSSCLHNEASGLHPECRKPEETLLCPLALARLRRVAATVTFHAKEVRLEQGAEFDATEFRGLLRFDEDPLHPIFLRITSIAPGVEVRAAPVVERMEAYSRSRKGEPLPQLKVVQLGEDLELPARIVVNDCTSSLSVLSHYSDAAASLRAEALQ